MYPPARTPRPPLAPVGALRCLGSRRLNGRGRGAALQVESLRGQIAPRRRSAQPGAFGPFVDGIGLSARRSQVDGNILRLLAHESPPGRKCKTPHKPRLLASVVGRQRALVFGCRIFYYSPRTMSTLRKLHVAGRRCMLSSSASCNASPQVLAGNGRRVAIHVAAIYNNVIDRAGRKHSNLEH